MTNKIKKFIYIFLLLVSLFAVSCEAPAPNKLDTGSEPYQKPYVPQNVVATKGEKDSITISWNPVEGADLYIIDGIPSSLFGDGEMEEYARTAESSYTFLLNGAGDGLSYRDFDADESYIFSVRAYVNFGSASNYLISDSSDYAEGCFAPETLEFHTSITSSSINFYWNLSNIYSTLSTGDEPTPLYIPSFVIEYRKKGEESWKQITKEEAGGKDPWMYASLSVAEYEFEHNAEYEFRITMTLSEGVVTPSTLQSGIFTTRISDDLSVSSVEELTATEGTLSDSVKVTWKIPSWSQPADRANSYFAIYRSEDGGEEKEIINEISALQQDSRITEESGLIVFTDTDTERGKNYTYRVVNAAVDLDGQLHEEEKDEAPTATGYVYNPVVKDIKGTFTANNEKTTATVDISFDYSPELPEDLTFAIERTVWHSKFDRTVVDYEEKVTKGSNSITFDESITNCGIDNCNEFYHSYKYTLVVLKNDKYFYTIKDINTTAYVLGEMNAEMAFTGFTASNDYVDAILISWKPVENVDTTIWSYKLDGNEYVTISNPTITNGIYSYLIEINDDNNHEILLKADDYESPEAREGQRLTLSSFAPSASDGASADDVMITWTPAESVSRDVVYRLYADETPLSVIDPEEGTYKATGLKNDGTVYEFSIRAHNKTQQGTPEVKSKADEGYVLPVPEILSVSKGEYSDRVVITWNADKLKDLVDGFEVIRNSSNSVDEEGLLHETSDPSTSSYEDKAVPSMKNDYYYFVRSLKNGISSHESVSVDAEDPDLLFDTEKNNCGYLFDTTLESITVKESVESNGKFISDYFIITVPAQKTIKTYELSAADGVVERYDMSELKGSSEPRLYTNGKANDEAGYFAYDDINEVMIFNSSCGLVSSDDFTVSGITVQGFGGKETDLPTNESTDTSSYRRGFNTYDYIKLFATAFNNALENSKPKSSDWWNLFEEGEKNKNGVFYKICYGSKSIPPEPRHLGYIYFTDCSYEGNINLSSNFEERMYVESRTGASGGAEAEGPLAIIGFVDDNNKTTMSFPNNIVVNGSVVKYKSVDVTVKNVIVEEGASNQGYGTYTFAIEDSSEPVSVTIDSSNINLVPVKP